MTPGVGSTTVPRIVAVVVEQGYWVVQQDYPVSSLSRDID